MALIMLVEDDIPSRTFMAEALDEEGYVLAGDSERIVVAGRSAAGTFYGLQTLKQLVRSRHGSVYVQGVQIVDWPSVRWRGLSDDVSRGPVPTTGRVVRVTPACPPTQTCVVLSPNGSTLKAGETLPVSVSASDVVVSAGRAFDVRIESVVGGGPVGQLDVRFAVN